MTSRSLDGSGTTRATRHHRPHRGRWFVADSVIGNPGMFSRARRTVERERNPTRSSTSSPTTTRMSRIRAMEPSEPRKPPKYAKTANPTMDSAAIWPASSPTTQPMANDVDVMGSLRIGTNVIATQSKRSPATMMFANAMASPFLADFSSRDVV